MLNTRHKTKIKRLTSNWINLESAAFGEEDIDHCTVLQEVKQVLNITYALYLLLDGI